MLQSGTSLTHQLLDPSGQRDLTISHRLVSCGSLTIFLRVGHDIVQARRALRRTSTAESANLADFTNIQIQHRSPALRSYLRYSLLFFIAMVVTWVCPQPLVSFSWKYLAVTYHPSQIPQTLADSPPSCHSDTRLGQSHLLHRQPDSRTLPPPLHHRPRPPSPRLLELPHLPLNLLPRLLEPLQRARQDSDPDTKDTAYPSCLGESLLLG